MDNYIRDFKISKVKNESLNAATELKQLLNKAKGDHFRIFHNNIRSLSKNIDELKVTLNAYEIDFELIVLTETWRMANTDVFQMKNYNLIYNEGNINQSDGVGDINIDILGDSEYSQEYLNIMSAENYTSMINTYTRVQGDCKSCLDHIFLKTKIPQHFFLSLVLETDITDHYATILQYTDYTPLKEENINNNLEKNNYIQFIDYKNLNHKMKIENWSDIYVEKDLDKAAHIFINKLKSKIYDCTRKVKVKRAERKKNDWVTQGYQSNLPDFNSLKYLGIIIDRHLRWDEHMRYIIKKTRCLLPKFKYFRNVCHIKQLNIMYFALIQSHLIYGIIGWGGVNNNYLKNLETAQKWTIKIMHNKNYTYPSEELYKEAKILDLRQLYARSLLLRQYKLKPNINMYPNYNYDTRNKETMKFPKTAKTVGQRCHTFLGPVLYNALPPEIKPTGCFRHRLKTVRDHSGATGYHSVGFALSFRRGIKIREKKSPRRPCRISAPRSPPESAFATDERPFSGAPYRFFPSPRVGSKIDKKRDARSTNLLQAFGRTLISTRKPRTPSTPTPPGDAKNSELDVAARSAGVRPAAGAFVALL
ncbi:hypothetical protein NQ317_008923 [Molorchus minor]|uniref:Reverse transcriptase domain-containing protein n=1 Tax=Molorchus minor TaxID=1323400 RepID=A0ABQ9JSL4_9CUCU|nr:hypothetical protein NQ317_008923 [Molorchus minor]